MRQYLLGFTAQKDTLHPPPAVGCHDDEITTTLSGGPDDRLVWMIVRGIRRVAGYARFVCGRFDHAEVLRGMRLAIPRKLFAGVLQHFRPIREDLNCGMT
jgi:hypothetical protein